MTPWPGLTREQIEATASAYLTGIEKMGAVLAVTAAAGEDLTKAMTAIEEAAITQLHVALRRRGASHVQADAAIVEILQAAGRHHRLVSEVPAGTA